MAAGNLRWALRGTWSLLWTLGCQAWGMATRTAYPSDVSDDEWAVQLAYVAQGYTGAAPAEAAPDQGIQPEVVKYPGSTHGFVLLPRRCVVERSFASKSRFRRLVRDYERLETTLAGFHVVAFPCLAVARAAPLLPKVQNNC